MILTSNRGFKDWGEIFGDNVIAAALLDKATSPCDRHRNRGQLVPASGSMLNWSRNPCRGSGKKALNRHRRGEAGHQKLLLHRSISDRNLIGGGEFYFGTNGENYFGIDT